MDDPNIQQTLLNTRAFVDALAGFLLPDAANQQRRPLVLRRLEAMASWR